MLYLPAISVTLPSESADNRGTAFSKSSLKVTLKPTLCDALLLNESGLNSADIINLVLFFCEHVGQTLSERNVVKTG